MGRSFLAHREGGANGGIHASGEGDDGLDRVGHKSNFNTCGIESVSHVRLDRGITGRVTLTPIPGECADGSSVSGL